MQSLLTQTGDVATNASERLGSLLAAEATRYLLLYLGHTQVPFSLVVVKGHSEVMHKTQHISFIVAQPHQQVVGFALLHPPLSRLRRWRVGRVALQALDHQFAVAPFERCQTPLRQASLPRVPRR